MEDFFLTFRKFIKAHQLLQFMFDRYESAVHNKEDIVIETVQTLVYWTKYYPQDFSCDENATKLLYSLLDSDPFNCLPEVLIIHKQLNCKSEPSPLIDIGYFRAQSKEKKLEFLTISPNELARQLTLLEFKMFQQVAPLDLVTTSSRFVF